MVNPVAITRTYTVRKLLFTIFLAVAFVAPLGAQKSELGVVRGVVQTNQGRPVGGFWLMIINPDLGMNYRKDVNPIGQFTFTDIYPGTYVFKISPNSYTVVSPSQIVVKGGDSLDVKVIVAAAPRSIGLSKPAMPAAPHAAVARGNRDSSMDDQRVTRLPEH